MTSFEKSKRTVTRILDRYMAARQVEKDRSDRAKRGEHVTGAEVAWGRVFIVTVLVIASVYVLVKLH